MAEQGAAPAGVVSQTMHSGGVWGPPGWPLRAACQELADDPEAVSRTKARPDAETRTPRWSAERRAGRRYRPEGCGASPDPPSREAGHDGGRCGPAPVGAPLPSLWGREHGNTAYPAPQTIRAAALVS